MVTPAQRVQARRIFEESIREALQDSIPCEDVFLDATLADATSQRVVVARYKVYTDGRLECFEILDEVLWPTV